MVGTSESARLPGAPEGAGAGCAAPLAGLVAALLALLALAGAMRASLGPALAALVHGSPPSQPAAIASLVAPPAVAVTVGLLTHFAARQLVLVLELDGYLRTLRRWHDRALRAGAPLLQLGYTGTAVLAADTGGPAGGETEAPLAAVLSRGRATLVLGEDGVGKTTSLRQYARELSRRGRTLAIAFGRQPLPVPFSLAAYVMAREEGGGPRLGFLAGHLAALGHTRLAASLPHALRRAPLVFLCDGLDEVPAAQRAQVAAELARLVDPAFPRVRAVITCATRVALADPAAMEPLGAFRRVRLRGMDDGDVRRVLRQAQRAQRVPGEAGEAPAARLAASALGAQARRPATVAAFLAVRAAGASIPSGRGRLLRAQADLLCARAATEDLDAAAMARLLGRVADTLRRTGTAAIPVPLGEEPGPAVARWLEAHRPSSPATAAGWAPPATPAATARGASAALGAGILELDLGGECVRFGRRALEAVFAAIALATADDGTRPLAPAAVSPDWQEPLLLWSGWAEPLGGVALRLLAAADGRASAPHGHTLADGGARAAVPVRVRALATALAAMLEATAPGLAATPAGEGAAKPGAHDATRELLRDVFDRTEALLAEPSGRTQLAAAVRDVERDGATDCAAHLAAIVGAPALGRLVRAQAVSVLALSPSPAAVESVVALIGERDPVLREAFNRACASGNPELLARLRRELGSADERTRARATEALGQAGPAAVATALAGLGAGDPPQRAAAARVLGALGAGEAVDALAARLGDADADVRAAAAWALGQIATERAIAPLESRLGTADAALRAALAEALGHIRAGRAYTLLAGLLDDADARVRAAAAAALGTLGDERAIRALRDHLGDRDPWTQTATASALRRLGSK